MTIEPDYQKVYNSRWFQENYIRNLPDDPDLYLTRLLNYNYNAIAKNFGGYYDTILKCPTITYEILGTMLYVTVSPMNFIMDSTYFEIESSTELSFDLSSLPVTIYPLTSIVVLKYKYEHAYIDQKAKLELFMFDSLRDDIFPDTFDHSSHYMFLELKNVYLDYTNFSNSRFGRFMRLPLPPCVSEGTGDFNCDTPPNNFSYEHAHIFTHTHEYTEPHTHNDVMVSFAQLGGQYITNLYGTFYITDESGNFLTNEGGTFIIYDNSPRVCNFHIKDSLGNPILNDNGDPIILIMDINELAVEIRQDETGYYIQDENANRYYITNDITGVFENIPFITNQLPNCSDFINYIGIEDGLLSINGTFIKYNYNYCYFLEFVNYFLLMLNDLLLRFYVRKIPIPSDLDYLYQRFIHIYGEL